MMLARGACLLLVVIGWMASLPASGANKNSGRRHLHVGTLTLDSCGSIPAYCGRLQRPLDPDHASAGEISVHFEFYPHLRPGRSVGTLVATEGGPGYPATGSRDDYLALFQPLRGDRDVLIMDNRGTGRSGALECQGLQTGQKWTVEAVAECGASLGAAASLYGTPYAADDLAAVLSALGVRTIDLYGDSYGTYFEQVFALRHPGLLRSVVLDGAYPLTGPDYGWYPNYAPAMRAKFDIACARSAPCAALPGSSMDHIAPALAQLRTAPFAAHAFALDGVERRFQADASQLAIVMYGSAPALTTAREVDAAARAFVQGDRIPLLRLMAETAAAVDSRDPTADPTRWSAGLAAAVMCQDPPQIFDMRLPPTQRLLDRDRALAARRQSAPDTYAPFTIDEYRGMPLDYAFIDQCVAWPVSPPGRAAAQVGKDASYPDIPALVISGELDNLTTMADGAEVARTFPHGRQVKIVNSFHVNALARARSSCGAELVRRFLTTLAPGDASCAERVPPLRLVSNFARRSGQLDAARSLPGNAATPAQLRIVTAALLSAGDALARAGAGSSGQGVGLRGGTFRVHRVKTGMQVELDRVRWVEDVAVSGRILAPTDHRSMTRATLRVAPNEGGAGRLIAEWQDGIDEAVARIHGRIGRAQTAAETSAP